MIPLLVVLMAAATPAPASSALEELRGLGDGAATAAVAVPAGRPMQADSDFPALLALESRLLLVPPSEDLDGDGLADAAELELARSARPYLVFSAQENALESGEPKTLFQVRPLGCAGPRSRCEGRPLDVFVTYLNLWRRDGGYGRISWCRDRHIGDNQAVRLKLRSDDDGHTFRIVEVDNIGYVWPTKSGAVRFKDGVHPEIYFSAGKHHQFFDASMHGRASVYTKWGCSETLDADGPQFLSRLAGNVGEPEKRAGFVDDLAPFGFPGERAWDDKPFCGSLPCRNNPTQHNAKVWSTARFDVPALQPL